MRTPVYMEIETPACLCHVRTGNNENVDVEQWIKIETTFKADDSPATESLENPGNTYPHYYLCS